jgi:hypothetical protein
MIKVSSVDFAVLEPKDIDILHKQAKVAFDTIDKFTLFRIGWITRDRCIVRDKDKQQFARTLGVLGWTCIFDDTRLYLTTERATELIPGQAYVFRRRTGSRDCYLSDFGSPAYEIHVDEGELDAIQDGYK